MNAPPNINHRRSVSSIQRDALAQRSCTKWRGISLLKLFRILLLAMAFGLMIAREATANATCLASSPAGGRYTVNVCIMPPDIGVQLAGNQIVQASVAVTGDNPGVQSLTFFLDGQYLITDFQSPYTFILPTETWVDGHHRLAIAANMRDGFKSQRASTGVTLRNGVTTPPVNGNTFTPTNGTVPAQGQPFILAATGDGAAGDTGAASVTDIIDAWNPNMFLYLGDVYANGSSTEFANWYAPDDYFGRFREITNPTVGNHEYQTTNAQGYFDFWDNVSDFYSVDAAGWHIISLNSYQPNSWDEQLEWLEQDLQAHTSPCTLVFYHHPLFSIGPRDGESNAGMVDVWRLLDKKGVDVVLTGHDHSYQRWKPLNGAGELDPSGITQFVIGAGGHGVQGFIRTDNRLAASDATTGHYGALRMELNPDGASYQYVTTAGTEDSGAIACDGVADTTPPTAPTGLKATISPEGRVALAWTAATDRVGVSGHQVYRDGALLTTIGAVTTHTDTVVIPLTSYSYELRATDADGNVSEPSNQATVTTPALSLHFSDGFESGTTGQWTRVSGPLSAQQDEVASGAWAARATSTGAAAFASKTLATAQTDLYYRIKVKLLSAPTDSTYLARFRTESNLSILGLYVSRTGKLSVRNDVAGVSRSSRQVVSMGEWHEVQIRLRVDAAIPAAGQIDVWFDGISLPDLSGTQDFGPTPVRLLQLGENANGRTFDIVFDDVVADTSFILAAPASTAPPAATPSPISTSTATRTENASLTTTAPEMPTLERDENTQSDDGDNAERLNERRGDLESGGKLRPDASPNQGTETNSPGDDARISTTRAAPSRSLLASRRKASIRGRRPR